MEIVIIIIVLIFIGIIFLIRGSEESWLDEAQEKHQRRFEYLNDHLTTKEDSNKEWDPKKGRWIDKEEEARKERYQKYHENLPPSYDQWRAQVKEEIRHKHKIVKNQTFEKWIEEHQGDGFQGNRKDGTKWYPTGWTYNEKKKLWEPPNYVKSERETEAEKKERLERYRKYHEGQPPTFEEWKAQREKEQQK